MQYAEAFVCRDYVVLKSEQVGVEGIKENTVLYRLAMARAFVTMYQLVLFLFDHKRGRIGAELSVVVSPLVSLMVDLVSSLHSRGISDAILSGNSCRG